MTPPTPPTWIERVRAFLTPPRLATLLALVTLLTGAVVVIESDPDGDGPKRGSVTVVVPLENAEGEPAPATTPATAVDAAEDGLSDHAGSRSEQPDGVSAADLDAGREQQERLAANDQLPAVTPDAAPQQAGCTTRLVQNYSSRRGVAPRLFVVHYTVSPNRPGWSDVWAIASLFDRPSFAASSNYIVDDAGNCAYIVRESDKAWTQAGLNPVAISVEIIATGKEGRLASAAGFAKLGRIASDAMGRWSIPLQMGKVSGCTVTRPGLIDHRALGACGGGHVDVSPYSPAPILAAAKAARGAGKTSAKYGEAGYNLKALTAGERAQARKLLAERRIALRKGGWSKAHPSHLAAAKRAKAALVERKVWLGARLSSKANRAERFRVIRAVLAT